MAARRRRRWGYPPPPGPPPPKTKVTITGKHKIYHSENLIGPFLVHQLLDASPHPAPLLSPNTPPPLPPPTSPPPPPAEEEGKEKRAQIIVVVRSPCRENYPADAHPSLLKSVLESANPAWTQSVHLDAPGQRHGQQPVSGTADPGVVKQDKSSRGSVDTTKTRSGPRRVRMSSGRGQ